MRVTATTREGHAAAILDAAGRLFRRRGLDGVSVADVTRAAGLTHGAFYGHFASKAALAEAACRRSLDLAAARWQCHAGRAREAGSCGVLAIVDLYLSERHRDAPDGGCAVAALGPEMVRADPALHAALSEGVEALEAALADAIAHAHPGASPSACARAATAVLATMTGGLVLARAATDPAKSEATLAAARLGAARAAVPEFERSLHSPADGGRPLP